MRIKCTVNEFAEMVRRCFSTVEAGECEKCPLYDMCDCDGIEQFVMGRDIIHECEGSLNEQQT